MMEPPMESGQQKTPSARRLPLSPSPAVSPLVSTGLQPGESDHRKTSAALAASPTREMFSGAMKLRGERARLRRRQQRSLPAFAYSAYSAVVVPSPSVATGRAASDNHGAQLVQKNIASRKHGFKTIWYLNPRIARITAKQDLHSCKFAKLRICPPGSDPRPSDYSAAK